MSIVFTKVIIMSFFAFIWAGLQIATTSRTPIRHEEFNELEPGLMCHISMVVMWGGTVLLFYLFHMATDLQQTQLDEWIFAVIFGIFFIITLQTYLIKIVYDEYYLCFKSPLGIRIYDWDDLTKISEWSNLYGSTIILKFSKRFWVAISAMYEGYDELERLAYTKTYNYPRP